MEDSSTNPYIPRESEDVRKKVYERQSPLGRIVKWALIATAVAVVLIGGGLFFVIPRTTAVDQPARQKLADVLQPPDQTLKRVDVTSDMGFHLNYDNRVYDSHGEVGADVTAGTDNDTAVLTGASYENNDLRTQRAYNYMRIRPVESVDTSRALTPDPPQLEIFATMTSKELATAAAVPENKSLSQLSLFVKIDSDRRLAKKVADDKTVVTIDATKPVSATIGDVQYEKVRFTTTNNNYRISDTKYDECYYTIQNGQPYTICVSGVRPTNVGAASLVENVFNSITYQQPSVTTDTTTSGASSTNGKKTTYRYPLALLTQATTTDNGANAADSNDGNTSESSLLTVTPEYYKDADSLTAIAKTQPSVVRIGTLYCANLSLKFVSGDTAATITDACVGNVATGVAISKDGYIATTGHAIRNQKKAAIGGYINFAPNQDAMMDRLQSVLDYLLKSKIILQSDADYLKTGAQTGDQEALAKIENIGSVIPDNFIVPDSEQYTYAIQPTDKPIVVNTNNGSKPSFAYSDTVLEGKYVASDLGSQSSSSTDTSSSDQAGQDVFTSPSTSADVGLLKVNASFQDVPIAGQQTVKANDIVSTLGFPAYADSSLAIDKIRNQPIVTTNKVNQVYKKDTGQLIETDNPVLPGNDGAPVVDKTGQLIGLAIYGQSFCPDQQCFASGTVRPSSELLKLLDANNINLQTGSPAMKSWSEGVDQYFRANYAAATTAFATAVSLYSANVWGQSLEKLASTAQGTANDTSFMNQLEAVMIVLLIILVVVTVLLAVAAFIHKKAINRMQVGHYGAAETSPAVATPFPNIPAPQPLDQLPPLPTQQISNVTITPQPPSQSESPILPIREQSAPLPGATQPQTPTPPTSIPVTSEPKKPEPPTSGDSFYS